MNLHQYDSIIARLRSNPVVDEALVQFYETRRQRHLEEVRRTGFCGKAATVAASQTTLEGHDK